MTEELLDRFPAKTAKAAEPDGRTVLGISVLEHGELTAAVFRTLRKRFGLEALLPEGVELLAAAHDVGKINPLFIKKLVDASTLDEAERSFWEALLKDEPLDLKEVPHAQ